MTENITIQEANYKDSIIKIINEVKTSDIESIKEQINKKLFNIFCKY